MKSSSRYITEEYMTIILNTQIQKLKEDLPRLVEKFLEEKEHKKSRSILSHIQKNDKNNLQHLLKKTFISWSEKTDINCYT